MSENTSIEICPDGQHDFEEVAVPAAGAWGVLIGHSRCRACRTLADEAKVDGQALGANTQGAVADSGAPLPAPQLKRTASGDLEAQPYRQ
jgi:hypothetical protein